MKMLFSQSRNPRRQSYSINSSAVQQYASLRSTRPHHLQTLRRVEQRIAHAPRGRNLPKEALLLQKQNTCLLFIHTSMIVIQVNSGAWDIQLRHVEAASDE